MRILYVFLIALLLITVTGCGDHSATERLEGLFMKNGIAIHGIKPDQHPVIKMLVNGQEKAVTWSYLGGNIVLISENWQAGSQYEVQIEGKKWTEVAPLKSGVLIGGVPELDKLEEIPTVNDSGVIVFDDVAVSFDGQHIAVSSFDNRVYMYDRTGKKVWSYVVPSGTPISAVFSPDGMILYVGEASADANLYAFDTATGNLLWKYDFGSQIGHGSSPHWSNRPKVRSLAVQGDMLVAAGEFVQRVIEKSGERIIVTNPTSSIIIAFDGKTGVKRWQYPETEIMDTTISKITLSNDGQKVLFANYTHGGAGSQAEQRYPDGSIRVLNGQTGKLAGVYQLEPVKPYFKWVGINEGIHLSPNGQYAATFVGDNRGILFDLSEINLATNSGEIKLLWKRQVSKIHEVSGVPVYTSGNVAHVTDEGKVFFMTSSTYMADKSFALAPSFTHPDATTLFAYDQPGNLLWKWKSEGGLGKVRFSADSRYMVAAIYHSYVNRKKELSGLYCLDLQAAGSDKLIWFYPVGGVAVAGNIAYDGTVIAGTEAPLRLENGTTIGEHRLHILQ